MSRAEAGRRSAYLHFQPITTRWSDNDAYGHVNNVMYYSWFDTVVNTLLIHGGVLDLEHSPVIGLVIETHCNYFSSVAFPERVTAGLRVAHLGTSSVRYEVGIFREDDDQAAAQGHLVHVYVDRISRRPVAIPASMRQLLLSIQLPSTSMGPA
ncbi:thioesterase family protein [Actimicrobium antarcticum]|uniref:Thioesterase family protein n=1 Tax=Actimicrobium antarcticum TaxID=1051899 RepID=A0ABP7SYI1_9BURK